MQREQIVKYLRENPVFWSRLGFCYDPPACDENGEIIVFNKNFSEYTSVHDSFADAGVKIHTCILHSGWIGVDRFDYSLCDKVLESIFASGKVEYFIPRIKLNVPIDWCCAYPTEVCVYEDGPRDAEGIKTLVGTEKHDWLGYESEVGYYNANGWQDSRPNVGGVISLQSFSSEKWLDDACEVLSRLIDHIENSQYGERVIAYHIAFGACGESMLWGRQSKKFGDYGISNREHFLNWGIKKYGNQSKLLEMWGSQAANCIIPPPQLRESKTYRDESDIWSIDYDLYMSEVTTNAIMRFADVVHKKTDKAVGAFYGYILYMSRTAYTGHLAFERLLNSGKVDFFAAPKSYYRASPGEPGGEMTPAVSVNSKGLWLDECDVRTHLSSDTIGGVAKNAEETYAIQLREICKNISHNSGLWYMDLGGNWYNDAGIMENIRKIVLANEKIRKIPYRSVSEITVIVDESAVLKTIPSRVRPTENFLRELQLCGAPVDVIFFHDIGKIDLDNIKIAVLLTPYYLTCDDIIRLKSKINKDGTLLFVGKTRIDTTNKLVVSEETGYKTLRRIVEDAGVTCLAPENCAVYADNRIISFFPREDMSFVPTVSKDLKLSDFLTGETYVSGTPIHIKGALGKAFVIES